MVSAADPPRSLISVFYTGDATFFQVAPHLSSQGLSGPRSRPTATQKVCSAGNRTREVMEPGSLTTRQQRRSGKALHIFIMLTVLKYPMYLIGRSQLRSE
jgi:hypothetical protein